MNNKYQIANSKSQIKNVFGNSARGFTLVELLVVIAIIGILTSVLMVNFIGVRQRARDAQRKTHVKQIQSAFELYRSDFGRYPCFQSGCTSADASTIDNLTSTLSTYLSDDVVDPLYSAACPNYLIASSGSNYTIYVQLENSNDADATLSKRAPLVNAGSSFSSCSGSCTDYTVTTGTCGGTTYNYWVNNP